MSNEELLKQDPLVAPSDSDEQFITRFEYEDPIRKASIWLHKLIIHRLRDVQLAAPWYRGETDEPPGRFVSDLFSQADGRFCSRFDYFCRMVKKYRQGEVPRPVIEDDHRAVRILITALASACKHLSSEALADVASACKHGAKSLDRKADALLAVAGETLATAKRIDRRGRRANPRQKISTEVQEQCR